MKLLPVEYFGFTAMDKRFSTPMLPWVIAEIRRRGTINRICLGVEDGTVQAYDANFEQQFTHQIQLMLRFSRAASDLKTFMYILKDPQKPALLYCHLFRATRQDDVSDLFKQMREQGGLSGQQASGYMPSGGATSPTGRKYVPPQRSHSSAANLTSLCADISPSSSHFFEVLYIGKIKVSHKKVPDTFIDDALRKFELHEQEKLLKGKISSQSFNKRGQFDDIRRASQDSNASEAESIDSFPQNPSAPPLVSPLSPIESSSSTFTTPDQPQNELFISDQSIEDFRDKIRTNRKLQRTHTISECSDLGIKIERTESVSESNSECESLESAVGAHQHHHHHHHNHSHHDDSDHSNDEPIVRQRTYSESKATLESNLENVAKSLSRSHENLTIVTIPPTPQPEDELKPLQLGIPIAPHLSMRKSGSIEALPTVAEHMRDNIKDKRENPRARAASITGGALLRRQDSTDHNRTMVFQVGRIDLRLISPDRKQILLHKQLKDVATCIQGLINTEHFGFICREVSNDCFMGYIFKCQSDSVAVDVVQAIKQAYTAINEGAKFHRERPALVSCEHCPMVWYHKLCTELENQSDRKTQAIIFRRMASLDEEEQNKILTKFRGAEADTIREQNEFLMMLLRAHCEAKQTRHVHDTAENRSEFLNQYLGGSTIFMKAKRSLATSFDHLLKRKGSRDDFGPHVRELPLSRESSPNIQSLDLPCDSDQNSPIRSRTSTISSTNGEEKASTPEHDKAQLKSPMMDIFFKVGSSPKSPSHDKTLQSSSWRQEMFKKVLTPNKTSEEGDERRKRTREELRGLWKTAIKQAILLIRMEKENARLTARQEQSAVKRIKLEYDEICQCQNEFGQVWDHLLISKESRVTTKCDSQILLQAIRQGVPRSKRGEIWHFLAQQFCLKQYPFDASKYPNYNTPYEDLLKQLTSHQHAILIDLGRTFPNHTYYSSPLGPGQLALFNLLKAYSLLDPEVGYCQGLSFVAGILLLHMSESDAFFLLRHLMFRRGMRLQYLPDMEALQVNLYQLSRLLHDQVPELYEHFNKHEVAPTLYAAPWILTIFASQFPLGFVVRVFDVLFLESLDVIFRVAVSLLHSHKHELLACDGFEEIMDYLRNVLPNVDRKTMDKVMKEVFTSDVKKSLDEYKVEYHVLQEEMISVRPQLDSLAKLEQHNKQLVEQNQRLMEQLELALSNYHRLESSRTSNQTSMNRLESQVRSLEVTVNTLGQFLNSLVEQKVDIEIPGEVRRIVSQIALADQRRTIQNTAKSNVPNMKKLEPPKYMVKSLSMGKLGLNFNQTPNQTKPQNEQFPRSNSMNVNLGNSLAQNLKTQQYHQTSLPDPSVRRHSILSSVTESLSRIESNGHRGYPLRVIEDNQIYEPPITPVQSQPKPLQKSVSNPPTKPQLKSAISQPMLNIKPQGFFANSHNHIQQQRMQSLALKQGLRDVNQLIENISQQEVHQINNKNHQNLAANSQIEKSVSLPLPVQNMDYSMKNGNFDSSNLNNNNIHSSKNFNNNLVPGTKDINSDSGISTPLTPPANTIQAGNSFSEIPLFDSDVHCTFNGTTKLKSIKSTAKLVKP